MVLTGNKAKRYSPVNHTTKTIHHRQHNICFYHKAIDKIFKGKYYVGISENFVIYIYF